MITAICQFINILAFPFFMYFVLSRLKKIHDTLIKISSQLEQNQEFHNDENTES